VAVEEGTIMPELMYLRPEARPVHWSLLEEPQLAAFQHILKAMVEVTTRTLPQSAPRRDARLDDPAQWLSPYRSSQILFLDGARGTGKTTVLTSLINASLDEPRTASQQVPAPNPALAPTPGALEILRTRVVWLEPLDMEPAPLSLNLLAAILARIDAATYRLGVRGGAGEADREREYRGLLDPSPNLQDAFVQLQRLQANTALAWDSNLAARAGSLDSDSYAVEVMRTERARLSVNHTLETVLDALAYSAFRGTAVHNPLFVLPIDDFDLNPSMSLALLQLLRMISVPRLFTLVLGDLRVAEIIANLKVSSDLATVAETAAHTNLLSMPSGVITAMGADLAANLLRKLIPPGQRIQLRHLDLVEALNFRPLSSSDPEPRLHGLLGMCPLRVHGAQQPTTLTMQGVAINNLRDFLFVPKLAFASSTVPLSAKPPAKKLKASELQRQALAYSGVALLHTSLRRITDLWLALQQPPDASDDPLPGARPLDLVALFAEYCRLALAEERAFFPEQGQAAIAAIQKEPTGEWNLGMLPIRVTPRVDPWHSMRLELPEFFDKETLIYIHVRHALGWRFETTSVAVSRPGSEDQIESNLDLLSRSINSMQVHGNLYINMNASDISTQTDQGAGRLLSEETAGALTLFHDLLALDSTHRSFISPLLRSDLLRQPWVVIEVSRFFDKVTWPWPVPPFTSFWEFDLFLPLWNEALQEFGASGSLSRRSLTHLAAVWMTAGTAILLGTGDMPLVWSDLLAPPFWDTLIIDLITLATEYTLRGRKAHDWLISMAVLLMPENGVLLPELPLSLSPLTAFWHQERALELISLRRENYISEFARRGFGTDRVERLRTAPIP
jgi:hypothetical protein